MTVRGANLRSYWAASTAPALRSTPRRLPVPLTFGLLVLCAATCPAPALYAQALPAATANPISTGFELPTAAGSLSYSVTGSGSFTKGFYSSSGIDSSAGLGANLALITASKSDPFSMVLSAGKSWSLSAGQPSPVYLDLSASQVINFHKWNAVVSDSVAYLPATPSTGLSGIPGTGDLGIPPIQSGFYDGQGLLTAYSTRISESASLGIGRRLTSRISLNGGGSYGMMRFLGQSAGVGLDTTSYTGSGGLSYGLDARSTLSGNYSYSTFSYTGNIAGFSSQTADVGYSHQFSRILSMDAFAGPQWTSISSQGIQLFPGLAQSPRTAVSLFLNTDLNYVGKFATYSLGYSRGNNSGFGVTPGGESDSLHFSASKSLSRVWNVAGTSAYTRTTSIAGGGTFAPSTFIVSIQASRALGRNLSAYASYTLEKQSATGINVGVFDLFSGSFQVASFGVTYSPRPLRFGAR